MSASLNIPGPLTRLTDADLPVFLAENPGVVARKMADVPGLTFYGQRASTGWLRIIAFHQDKPTAL